MKIQIIGNGSALNPAMTNTSFLVNDSLLIDCGYNVYPKLVEKGIVDDIKHVLITHCHADHVGSLETFIFHRMYKSQKGVPEVIDFGHNGLWKHIDPTTKTYTYPDNAGRDNNKHIVDARDSYRISGELITVDALDLTSHMIEDATAYFIMQEALDGRKKLAVFTGDTKANIEIQNKAHEMITEHNIDLGDFLVFHDYSNWDSLNNVHACKTDFEEIYSDWFKMSCEHVHDDNPELVDKIFAI